MATNLHAYQSADPASTTVEPDKITGANQSGPIVGYGIVGCPRALASAFIAIHDSSFPVSGIFLSPQVTSAARSNRITLS